MEVRCRCSNVERYWQKTVRASGPKWAPARDAAPARYLAIQLLCLSFSSHFIVFISVARVEDAEAGGGWSFRALGAPRRATGAKLCSSKQ